MRSTLFATACLALLAGQTIAHTFVEQLQIISDEGLYSGPMGYIRSFTDRGLPGFDQKKNLHQAPPLDRPSRRIDDTDLACHPDQQTPKYSDALPMLKAAPGNFVAIRFLENGHTTHVDGGLDGAKAPEGSGSVYLFGTFEPKEGEKLGDILQWTRDGQGGDKRGKLIIAQNYDDNRCYQLPSANRTIYFDERANAFGQGKAEVWCESDLPIPGDVEVGKTLTVYWVWDWPSFGIDSKDEYYTSCMDIEIVGETPTGEAKPPLMQQDLNTIAVSDYKSRTAITNTPRTIGSAPTEPAGPDGGPGPAPTDAAPAEPAPSSSPPDSAAPTSAPASAPPASAVPPPAATTPPPGGEAAVPTISGRPDSPPAGGDAAGMTTVVIQQTVYITGPPPAATPAAQDAAQAAAEVPAQVAAEGNSLLAAASAILAAHTAGQPPAVTARSFRA